MADGSGQTAWSYNVKGEVLQERRTIGSVTKTITYAYNSDGSLNKVTYPGGQWAGSSYDASEQLSALWDSQGVDYFISPTYAANGVLNQVQSNGYTMAWTYNQRFWPSSFIENPGGTSHRVNLTFGYLGNGDVSLVQNNNNSNRTANYTYDSLNRIATAYSSANSGVDCWGQSFGYDRYANLTAINSTKCSSPTMSVTVNAKNQVTNSGFTYDNAGRLTADGTYTYAWDGESRLCSVGGTSCSNGTMYSYDGDGKRVEKSSGTIYWYDVSGNMIEETDLSGNLVNDYVYAAGMRLGRRDSAGRVYTYFNDPLGSPRYIQGPSSTQAESDYYPFGGERVISNTLASANNYKFTSMERDTESGLDHTLFRQFSSNYGRWLSPDPLGGEITNPQSLNRYAYVVNDPCSLSDPYGLSSSCNFNIAIANLNLLSPQEELNAWKELNRILGTGDMGAVLVNSNADFTITLANYPRTWLGMITAPSGTSIDTYGQNDCWFCASPAESAHVFINNITDAVAINAPNLDWGIAIGRVIAHEFAHYATGYAGHTDPTKDIGILTSGLAGITDDENATLTPSQIPKLMGLCKTLRQKTLGGGGNGNPSGGNGGIMALTIGDCGTTSEDGGQGWVCNTYYTWMPFPIQRK